jgi:hypothetical protein
MKQRIRLSSQITRVLGTCGGGPTPVVGDYYVSPSGNDGNSGEASAPFRSLARAITAAQAGNVIVLKDGTYPADTPLSPGSTTGWLIWIQKSGTSTNPITIRAEHRRMAILDAGNTPGSDIKTGANGYLYFGTTGPAYWILDGLVFTGSWESVVHMGSGASTATPAHDITIQNCTFHGIGQHYEAGSWGLNGIFVGRDHYNITVTQNIFTQIGRTGPSTAFAHDHGIYSFGANSFVSNNLFLGPIVGWGIQTANGFSGLIANNTYAFDMTNNGGQIMLWDVAGGAIRIINNIFYQPRSNYAINNCCLTGASGSVVDSNLVFPGFIGTGSSNVAVANTCGGCSQGTTILTATNTVNADPAFVNAGALDFRLQPSSPARSIGVTLPEVTVDFLGNPRPSGNYNLGAYQ